MKDKKLKRILIIVIITTFLIICGTKYFTNNYYIVKGNSMNPTIENNDIVKIQKNLKEYHKGDIVIFKYKDVVYIKRIIGIPNDVIKIEKNYLYVNNKEIFKLNIKNKDKIKLKINEYFVLGDNLNESFDSRNFGPVEKEMILGKVYDK